MILAGWTLRAAEPAGYRVGDVAEADVTTPVALEVVDPAATVALRAAKAREVPVVFRSFPVSTNGLTIEFQEVFAQAQKNFLAAVAASFHTQTVSTAVIASPEFAQFFAAYNAQGRFPVTTELAAEWAQGGDGGEMRDALLGRLQLAASRPVRSDDLPEGFVPGKTVRLVPVTAVNQILSVEEVQRGRLVPGTELVTVAGAQKLFCDGFSAGEQPCARAAAALLKPNCFPDAPFTQLLSGMAVYQLVVSEHFDAGEIILHQGDTIDVRAKAALDLLNEKAVPVPVAAPIKTAVIPVPSAPPTVATTVQPAAFNPPPAVVKGRAPARWLILVLAGISAGALLVARRQMMMRRKPLSAPPVAPATSTAIVAYPAESVTNLTQAMRDAVVQELALQRRELLVAQQAATDEIATLVRRLDDLQLPMQERERTYEARIKSLETELALRTEENRELLKLKLETVRRQLETERSARTTAGGPWDN
jgi:hypothetical protein